jgi:uncharacterized protein (DUF433 family)
MIQNELVAIPRKKAAGLVGARVAKIDYWTEQGLLGDVPETFYLTPHRVRRLYDYTDLMSLMVVNELRRRGVSLQGVRRITKELRALGYDRPLTEVSYAVVGGKVFLQLPDGTWMDGDRPSQGVLPETLNLAAMQVTIGRMIGRPADSEGQFERRRGALGSKDLIAGTRIPVATVRRYLDARRTPDQIIESFPDLTLADIEAVRSTAA